MAYVEVELPVTKAGRFQLKNSVLLKVPKNVLERQAGLASADAKRVHKGPKGDVVHVPVTWLVGERVGY